MTKPSVPIRPQHSLLPWVLTAGGVIAGPSLLAAALASPALTMASMATGLTALVIGFALWQRRHPVAATVSVRRQVRPLGSTPP